MAHGTIYPLIKRMLDQGFIDVVSVEPAGKSGKPRKHYGISEEGTIRLQEELSRYKNVVDLAKRTTLFENNVPTDIQWMMAKTGIHPEAN